MFLSSMFQALAEHASADVDDALRKGWGVEMTVALPQCGTLNMRLNKFIYKLQNLIIVSKHATNHF
jgi:hypothetical protein